MPSQTTEKKDQKGRPKWLGYAQLALIAALVLVAIYFARAPDRMETDIMAGPETGSGNLVVNVFNPAPTSQSLTVKLTGNVKTEARVKVRSELVGRVVWVSPQFRNGGTLAANEPLVRIDRTEYELHVEAAAGMVEEAEARLAALMSGPTAEGTLKRARAALRLAELDLERTEISFPYESRVISSDVGVGELVGQQDEVGSQANMGIIYRSDALEIDAPIDMEDLEYLAPAIGRTAQVSTDSGDYEAEIMRISSVLAPQTRFASLFLRFSEDQSAESLPLPGTFVEVEVEGPSFENVYVLPDSVLQDSDTVWVVRDGALSLVSPLAIGRTEEGLVVAAFDAGDGIVVGSLPGAREGLEVDLAESQL